MVVLGVISQNFLIHLGLGLGLGLCLGRGRGRGLGLGYGLGLGLVLVLVREYGTSSPHLPGTAYARWYTG